MTDSPMPRYCAVVLVALLATAPVARGEVLFTALAEGVWGLQKATGVDEPSTTPLRPHLTSDASAPALSPDGARVAFEVPGRGILVCPVEAEGSCSTLTTEIGWPVRPTWHPTTGELVFVRYVADSSGEDSDILIASADLSEIRPLVTQTGNQDNPDLSPDGRTLVYDSAQTVALHRGGVQVVRHLWVMDLETGTARPLVPGAGQDMEADVSPDGRWVAFASDRGGDGFDIWVVGLDGEGLRRVTSGEGTKRWPAWSPAGERLLFTRAHDGRTALWLTAADGSSTERFEPFGRGSEVELRDPDWR